MQVGRHDGGFTVVLQLQQMGRVWFIILQQVWLESTLQLIVVHSNRSSMNMLGCVIEVVVVVISSNS